MKPTTAISSGFEFQTLTTTVARTTMPCDNPLAKLSTRVLLRSLGRISRPETTGSGSSQKLASEVLGNLAREAIFTRPTAAPFDPLFDDTEFPIALRNKTAEVLHSAYAPATLPTYGTGVRHFVKWCQRSDLAGATCFPALEHVLVTYACALAGEVGKSTARNYLCGIRAWHIINGADWNTSVRLELAMKAVGVLAPEGKPPRPPISREMIELLVRELDLSDPVEACVAGTACVAFWTQSRLGELLSPFANKWDRIRTLRRCHVGDSLTAQGTRKLHYPWTKTKGTQGDVSFINRQQGLTDPVFALEHHLVINEVPIDLPLFSFKVPSGWMCLTKKRLLMICNNIWERHGIPRLTGHSFRIGGTTELLKAGVDPSVVKIAGRWSSDSFLRYWHHVDIIIPLHLENLPHETIQFFSDLEKSSKPSRSTKQSDDLKTDAFSETAGLVRAVSQPGKRLKSAMKKSCLRRG